ncbi:MAG: 1-deoxy-D-xylulose-5-phosphate reductoisomerase [Alphaproteobacteria bacterium]|nr:1-deoxy-D-xylulose-5-phosphate reductoisomerase [Alphaproteobacteria bacterium]
MKPIAASGNFGDVPSLQEVIHRRVTVLGSTGSIGVNTLDVVAHARKVYGGEAFPLAALTAQGNVKLLIEQSRALKPSRAVIGDSALYGELKAGLAGTGVEAAAGREAVIAAAGLESDFVMVAIMGAAAIEPALAAIARGVIVALANKECVVAAGAVFRDALERAGASVIPVDSEHNAIFQVLGSGDAGDVEKVTITASGGPFREWPLEKMRAATVEEAVAHPNWAMGRKISLDSATLMNKGLELIEAHFLFALPPEKLDVLVHPQSIVHCLVGYDDGTTMAHLSAPDMRTPIAHALAWPRRIASPSRRLDLARLGQLVFQAPAHDRFPALNLAIESMRSGGLAPTVLNAANEIAVQAFLDRRIGFLDISKVVGETLNADAIQGSNGQAGDLGTVLGTDARARALAEEICQRVGM